MTRDDRDDHVLGERIRSHLHDRAGEMEVGGSGLRATIANGRRRRRRRRRVTASVALSAVVAIAAGLVTLTGRHDVTGTRLEPGPDVSVDPAVLPSVTPALTGPAPFTWSVVPAATSAVTTDVHSNVAVTTNPYSVSTMPGTDTFGSVGVYRTEDGVSWSLTTPSSLAPLWLADVRSDGPFPASGGDESNDSGGTVYGLGTSPLPDSAASSDDPPAGDDVQVVSVLSTDGGATFAETALPVDLRSIRRDLGTSPVVEALELVDTAAATLAVVGISPQIRDASAVLPGGTLAAGEVAGVVDDGIAIYRPPTDLGALAAQLCPDGWTLRPGPAWDPSTSTTIAVGNAALTIPPDSISSTSTIVEEPAAPQDWHCAQPDGVVADDGYVDPALVHGELDRVVPFDDLGLSPDSVLALRQVPRVFRTTDHETWSELALPDGMAGRIDAVTSSGDGLAVTLIRSQSSPYQSAGWSLWLLDGNARWTEGSLPDGMSVHAFSANPSGGYVALGTLGTDFVAAATTDGLTWSVVSLDSVISPERRTYSVSKVATSPDGLSFVVGGVVDPLRAIGGVEIEEGDHTLRIEDTNGTATLLDSTGRALDRLTAGITTTSGWLRRTAAGIDLIDPTSGERIATVGQAEIEGAMLQVVTPNQLATEGPSAAFVVSTVDGVRWSATPLADIDPQIDLGTSVVNASATDAGVSFVFGGVVDVGANDPLDASGAPAGPAVLVGTPTTGSGG